MLAYQTSFWQFKIFKYISAGVFLFVVLTGIAMFFYPGGTLLDHSTTGYSFFSNAFSDLGSTHSYSGALNYISASLFAIALILAALSIIYFSLAFPQFFSQKNRGYLTIQISMYLGTLTGIHFIGVALTPGDISFPAHLYFAGWAFRLFTLTALFWSIAILRNREYPNRYAWIFIIFFLLLVCFVLLGIYGPSPSESQVGNIIQVTAQKIIVYAIVISILIQSQCALAINRKRQK